MAEDRNVLASAIRERREALGLTQVDVWQRGGPSNSTQTGLENGMPGKITPSTLRKVDAGLEWVPGTAAALLAGKPAPDAEPPVEETHGPQPDPEPQPEPEPLDELIAALSEIRDSADRAIAVVQRLKAADLSKVSDADLAAEALRRLPSWQALQRLPQA